MLTAEDVANAGVRGAVNTTLWEHFEVPVVRLDEQVAPGEHVWLLKSDTQACSCEHIGCMSANTLHTATLQTRCTNTLRRVSSSTFCGARAGCLPSEKCVLCLWR